MKQVTQRLEEVSIGFEHKIEVKYSVPVADFDKSLVRGRVVKLFQIKEDRYATALEAVAGSKLYSIVVDNDVAASLLVKHGCFEYRVNLIPNNKVVFKEVKREVVEYIRNVTRGKAKLALELVKYHMHVENTMKHIFGRTLVCEDADTAKKLAFDPYVKLRAVTLDGDIYEPTGVVEGGWQSSV